MSPRRARWLCWVVWALGLALLGLGAPLAAHAATLEADAPVDAALSEALLHQIALWIDLGELAKAEAVTRRMVKHVDDDPAWLEARLTVLDAADMDPWIRAEFTAPNARSARRDAWRAHQLRVGEITPDAAEATPALRAAAVEGWLVRGDANAAASALRTLSGAERDRLALAVAVARGDEDLALALANARLDEPGADVVPLAALWRMVPETPGKGGRAPSSSARLKATQRRAWDAAAALEVSASPRDLLRAARFWLAIGDEARLRSLAERIASRSTAGSVQGFVTALDQLPAAFDAWEAPQRPRWSESQLRSAGILLARQTAPTLPWARADEREVVAGALAAELDQLERIDEADAVREAYLDPCAPVGRALRSAKAGDRAEAWEEARERLWGCLGRVDLVPNDDVLGPSPAHELDDAGAAWAAFAEVVEALEDPRAAAEAWSLSARLAPTPARIASAQRAIARAGLTPDDDGLLPAAWTLAMIAEASWSSAGNALESGRARRGLARTAALVLGTADALAGRATPSDACLPTRRWACEVEQAVPQVAATRGGNPAILSGAAYEAATAWYDAFRETWVQRRGALSASNARPIDLATISAPRADGAPNLGSRFPTWSMGELSDASTEGKVVVLAWWASWCGPCTAELTLLDAAAATWAEQGWPVIVVAPGVDDDPAKHARAVQKLGLQHITALHAPGERNRLAVDTLPVVDVIDASGVLRMRHVGWGPDGLAEVEGAVRAWAKPPSSNPAP